MRFFLFVLILVAASPAFGNLVFFEDLSPANMYLGGDQNIGTYYSGLDLGPNVTGLDLTDSTAFPPHSGSIVVWDPDDLTVTISFSDPQSMVGIWYTSLDFLTLDVFDSSHGLLGEAIGSPNTDGNTGESDFLSISAANIASITLTGPPGGYVFDDLTFIAGGNEFCAGAFIRVASVGCGCSWVGGLPVERAETATPSTVLLMAA